MHLTRIRPCYFRGFGDSDWINLDSKLVALYGPNGHGKTSLAEAVEWLLYGKTRRRERGETLSQRDYQGSYRNVHSPNSTPTSVELVIRDGGGTEYEIRRELLIGPRNAESSRTYINGTQAKITTLRISSDELFKPVVAQDCLQEFIHAKPKERRDKVSSALGLEPLVRFKTAVDKARTRFQSSPPDYVVTAKSKLRAILAAMAESPSVRALHERWTGGQFDFAVHEAELKQAACNYLGTELDEVADIVRELTERRSDVARRVFDDAGIRVPTELDRKVGEVHQQQTEVVAALEALSVVLNEFFGTTASKYTELQLGLWRQGLNVSSPAHPDECPMCEAETFTVEKRSELQSRIDQSSAFTNALQKLRYESTRVADAIAAIPMLLPSCFPRGLSATERESLIRLFGDEAAWEVNGFLSRLDLYIGSVEQEGELLVNLSALMRDMPRLAADATTAAICSDFVARVSEVVNGSAVLVTEYAVGYETIYSEFGVKLAARIATSAVLKEIDGLLAPLRDWHHLQMVAEFEKLLRESLETVQQIERHIQAKQAALFGSRGKEITDWYDLMNPGAPVRYKKMEPGTDSLVLWAESFGREINAVACLSQCQLNCLGLSIHLFRALTPGSPFKFLLIDDPVQAMDDDHCQALIISVFKNLLDTGLQLIVCSHVQGVIDSVWENYFARQPIRLRISDYQQTGPVIEEAETLKSAVERAERLAEKNEDNRRLAIKVVRRCVELLVRSVCQHTDSAAPPTNANASNMMPYFRNCPGTTATQAQEIQNTINFSNPGPHTQTGWAIPTQPQITPHIVRLRQIAQQLGVWR